MANIPISGLPTVTPPVSASALVPIVQGGATDQAQVSQLITGLPQVTTSTDGKMIAADKLKLDGATDAATAGALVKRDGSGNFSSNVITAAQVTVTGSPSSSTDATNKAYVDAVAVGLTIKAAVKVATYSGSVTLSGGAPNSIDGISLVANDRILVKDQSSAVENGIYTVSVLGTGVNGTWVRATDADTGAKLPSNSYVFVQNGVHNASTSWVMNTLGVITIGVSNIVWILFNQTASISASSIVGQIVGSQIAALAISTAKFASGLTPVEIVGAMPTTANFQGRMVFLTTVDGSFAANKLYRWTDTSTTGNTFWTSIVPAVDITGQITTTQITDSGITTAKIASNAITTGKLNAGCITSNELASNSVIAGKIQAGAITATEIAVGTIDKTRISDGTITTDKIAANTILASNILAGTITGDRLAANTITASKIATSTITADRMSVTDLSAISANIGTITAGSITANATLNVGSGSYATLINSSGGISIASGHISLGGDGTNPYVDVKGYSGYSNSHIRIQATASGGIPPILQAIDSSSVLKANFSEGGISTFGSTDITSGRNFILSGDVRNASSDGWTPGLSDGSNKICFQWSGGELRIRVGVTDIGSVTLGP